MQAMRAGLVLLTLLGACNVSVDHAQTIVCGDWVCGAGWTCGPSGGCIPPGDHDGGPPRDPVCGDGHVDAVLDEQCDDGNDLDDDACTTACKWARCGDGIVRRGVEDCEAPTSPCSDHCLLPGDFVFDDGHVYDLNGNEGGGFEEARTGCAGLGVGRHLATLDQEFSAVHEHFLGQPTYWIGMSDLTEEGTFQWLTGEPVLVTHFLAGEPNSGGDSGLDEDCVDERPTFEGWNDEDCGQGGNAGLCEREPPLVVPADHHAYGISWIAADRPGSLVVCQDGLMDLALMDRPGELADMDQLPFVGDFRVADREGTTCKALHKDAGGVSLVDAPCDQLLFALCEAN
jgi:cysteine-rich repeat protein